MRLCVVYRVEEFAKVMYVVAFTFDDDSLCGRALSSIGVVIANRFDIQLEFGSFFGWIGF